MHLFLCLCVCAPRRGREKGFQEAVLGLAQRYCFRLCYLPHKVIDKIIVVVRWVLDGSTACTDCSVHKKLFLAPTLRGAEGWIQCRASIKG